MSDGIGSLDSLIGYCHVSRGIILVDNKGHWVIIRCFSIGIENGESEGVGKTISVVRGRGPTHCYCSSSVIKIEPRILSNGVSSHRY